MQTMGSDRRRVLLRDLADDNRKLLDCRFVDGWHYGDIAAHLAVPRCVLVDRLHLLRMNLRRKAKTVSQSVAHS